jgi:hypothetical protein
MRRFSPGAGIYFLFFPNDGKPPLTVRTDLREQSVVTTVLDLRERHSSASCSSLGRFDF